jgi:hypothetical protein
MGNSTWKMNPLPYGHSGGPPNFDPPCHETVDPKVNHTGLCSGQMPWDVAIIDELIIPASTPAGAYVLGFRWDCEETAQYVASSLPPPLSHHTIPLEATVQL